MSYDIELTNLAAKQLKKMDGSVKQMLLKGIKRLAERGDTIGKPLGGELAGCRELKFRADGLRLIYTIDNGTIIITILTIAKREDDVVFQMALNELKKEIAAAWSSTR
ncbi:hypothetical protein PWEIH_02362 [Listeria weihenstephanensis FSL R9-0317]|uniref:Type II toxin-antitoxin system RelE/ParE family toxin n=1 Tax=Listeria weihenstephanensis TaxID=1006155 RepID=A0A1S7FQT4_9LIST|nr:type II toxin-antitoxin system RelE/ParE family toxin [Listeria weihenstephanensis]AQY49806.1 hypothetical protein UE46_01185 [Listeria weihenstephanensis]EUJ41112.1 hypothetical protein PWEIH_02362 [Listeria weihenstephanensis FSL R9-0317]MBC1499008.1 type II toxin-antitoxin system RelE/ParE family toxin [Listeria weihenstephanensis]